MKTLTELRRQVALNARETHENEFRELIQIYERKGWMRIVRAEEVIIGDVYGTLDGLVKVKDNAEDEGNFWGEVIEPLHKDINKGDVFEYSYEDLYVGNPKDIEALKDWIINGAKHKNIDVVNTKPMQEMFERTLDDDEIENLIDKARQSALLHPIQQDGVGRQLVLRNHQMEKFHRTSVMKNLQKEKGMSDTVIKTGALMTKRYIIQQGQQGDVSAQLNGLASLILFAIAATDRGQSFMSRALATSGFFKGTTTK